MTTGSTSIDRILKIVGVLLACGGVVLAGGKLSERVSTNKQAIAKVETKVDKNQDKNDGCMEQHKRDNEATFNKLMDAIHKVQLKQTEQTGDIKWIRAKLENQ